MKYSAGINFMQKNDLLLSPVVFVKWWKKG